MVKPLQVDDIWAQRIISSVNGLEYGAVHIIVHDGRIVQIERTERSRYETESGENASRNRQTTSAKNPTGS